GDLNNLHSLYNYPMVADTSTTLNQVGQFEFLKYKQVTGLQTSGGYEGTISVAHVSAGAIVVTSSGASILLYRLSGLGYQSTTAGTGTNPLSATQLSAAKLAVNMISSLGDAPEVGANSRKNNSSAVDVTAPVLNRWKDELATPQSAPVLYKGVYVAVVGGQ